MVYKLEKEKNNSSCFYKKTLASFLVSNYAVWRKSFHGLQRHSKKLHKLLNEIKSKPSIIFISTLSIQSQNSLDLNENTSKVVLFKHGLYLLHQIQIIRIWCNLIMTRKKIKHGIIKLNHKPFFHGFLRD